MGWLRRRRVLLPGITVLTRRVTTVREAAAAAVDPMLPGRLRTALAVPPGMRFSELELWRRAPSRVSGQVLHFPK